MMKCWELLDLSPTVGSGPTIIGRLLDGQVFKTTTYRRGCGIKSTCNLKIPIKVASEKPPIEGQFVSFKTVNKGSTIGLIHHGKGWKQRANKRTIIISLHEIYIIFVMVVSMDSMLIVGTIMEMETSFLKTCWSW
ncbi:hypothetical protein M9H77_08705 [Catharanthus roseus]|uniref:Uncharacterized protein n=1 Tax=Catharanthus roseus TaxID=4058 RepID=A0ACC0BYM6_CATRO|nr:hypothetical protein M9H77_08705 [Catharanthus roseus]